jgi:hypothetical protein
MACRKAYHESTTVNMECPQSNQMGRSINDLLSTSCKLHSLLPFQKDRRGPAETKFNACEYDPHLHEKSQGMEKKFIFR